MAHVVLCTARGLMSTHTCVLAWHCLAISNTDAINPARMHCDPSFDKVDFRQGGALMAVKTRNSMGPRIRELRIERGMTLDELATAANISASHLSRLERGQTAPSFKVAADIAHHIGVKPSELATIQREQSDVDDHLIEALTARGLDAVMARHICDRISTAARSALLLALQTNPI